MQVGELIAILDELAPFSLAESWDNCGLLIGDASAHCERALVTLELTSEVLEEALAAGFTTVLTHHPVFFSPVRRLVESDARQRLVRRAVKAGVNVIACHTNLDAAPGGIADTVAQALALHNVSPLRMAHVAWYKLVGFIPADALPRVAGAVFSAGAGVIGDYSECAYSTDGLGWFRAGARANPAVGAVGAAEKVPEARWETVVPRSRLDAVLRAFVEAHPYEEPAFDVYPVEDRAPRSGLGRLGEPLEPLTVADLASQLAQAFALSTVSAGGATEKPITRVAVVPGSGRALIEEAAAAADVFISGDFSYHDSETARELGLALIAAPHGELEWGAMKRWSAALRDRLAVEDVVISLSSKWSPPWRPAIGGALGHGSSPKSEEERTVAAKAWIDGGSRGNPGPSAIGVVLKDESDRLLAETAAQIGSATNNVAEYRALLEALDLADRHGVRRLRILSDSELLVRQIGGEYRVKNEGLRQLFSEAKLRMAGFDRVEIGHIRREENARADELVNEALDGPSRRTPNRHRSPPAGE